MGRNDEAAREKRAREIEAKAVLAEIEKVDRAERLKEAIEAGKRARAEIEKRNEN